MNQDYHTELQAKETLNILSCYDQLRHWEDFNNLPKISGCLTKQKKFLSFQKEKSLKQNTHINKTESGKNFKLLLIPKKPIFQQRTQLIKNERKNKNIPQNRKKIVSKISTNNSTLEMNNENQAGKRQLNLMRFWFQHRFQENSMNNLIYRISEMRKGIRSVLS